MTRTRLTTFYIFVLLFAACGNPGNGDPATDDAGDQTAEIDVTAIESVEIVPGLSRRTLREGTGPVAEAGHTAVVHYTGWLYDETAPEFRGSKFDSSVDRGEYFEFPLGAGRVIRGWDQGVVGMQVGERRELTIAPELAYGDRGAGAAIPPGATLVFEVELADLKMPEQATPDAP
jgi:FKBP-type peptidyl-prolyl cis-trans isomerase